ncbi:Rho GTPase-activating protein 2 [Capsicum annuum]|uniref:Small ribosomal subunit protein mS29 n=1 Tax=Capsicum annuum TaxID=4072 RepID=A0A2G2XZN1_CAPAN|nr:Rho GTPase-activating protein 2 [Capsicum annuum]
MNARNIAMVFAPNMTQMSDPLTALTHAVQVMNLLKTLIMKTLREREEAEDGEYSPMSSRSSGRQTDVEFNSQLEMDTSCESAGPASDDDRADEQHRYSYSSEERDEVESLSEIEESFLRQLDENEHAKNDFRKQLEEFCAENIDGEDSRDTSVTLGDKVESKRSTGACGSMEDVHMVDDFLKYNKDHLQKFPCKNFEPIPLGEGAGVGWMKGADVVQIPEDYTLFDLVQVGLNSTHAAVGVLVRLREELSLVKDMPVLIAVDQYNSWFTFSEYQEPVTVRSCRPIHARELATVNAFRSMIHDNMMVGAFSHSTAVGKLRQDLPDVPADARVNFPRYSLDEAASVCHYYLRQRLIQREAFTEENWKKIYYLSNGNGTEIRWLVPFMR